MQAVWLYTASHFVYPRLRQIPLVSYRFQSRLFASWTDMFCLIPLPNLSIRVLDRHIWFKYRFLFCQFTFWTDMFGLIQLPVRLSASWTDMFDLIPLPFLSIRVLDRHEAREASGKAIFVSSPPCRQFSRLRLVRAKTLRREWLSSGETPV
jgi:hypothetical protein